MFTFFCKYVEIVFLFLLFLLAIISDCGTDKMEQYLCFATLKEIINIIKGHFMRIDNSSQFEYTVCEVAVYGAHLEIKYGIV